MFRGSIGINTFFALQIFYPLRFIQPGKIKFLVPFFKQGFIKKDLILHHEYFQINW